MIASVTVVLCALAPLARQTPSLDSAARQDAARVDRLAALPPRTTIAGYAGFQTTSRVEFSAQGAVPHVLETTYVFPERVRWQLTPLNARSGDRHVIYRCGQAFFELAAQQPRARLVTEAGREDELWRTTFAALELRRALFLWPDGFEWLGEGARRTALTASGETFEVELDSDGRPHTIFVQGARDTRETYRSITWRESRERFWPSTMELVTQSTPVWTERVEALETQLRVLDLFFLPTELRPAGSAPHDLPVLHADVPVAWWVRIALAEDIPWTEVTSRWRTETSRFDQPGAEAWKLEPGACVELDSRGRPRALLLRFQPGSGDPPEGLVKVREHTALTAALVAERVDLPGCVAALAASTPKTALAGTPYVRFTKEPSAAGPMRVVQPFQAPD